MFNNRLDVLVYGKTKLNYEFEQYLRKMYSLKVEYKTIQVKTHITCVPTLLLRDGEYCDPKLTQMLPILILDQKHEAYEFCIRNKPVGYPDMGITFGIRFFHPGVAICSDGVPIIGDANKVERILDGWVVSDGISESHRRFFRMAAQ